MSQRRKTSRPAAVHPPRARARSSLPPPLADDGVEGDGPGDDAGERVLSRPDGYYWLAPDGRQQVGPFDSLAEALADMDSGDATGWVPGETLAEAESEIGVADWIDPDSGLPAEGQARPHLDRE